MSAPHSHWLQKWVNISIRFYGVFLLAAILLTIWSVPRTLDLYKHINTDLVALLPERYPVVQELFHVRAKTDRGAELTLVLEAKKPETAFKLMQELANTLNADPEFEVSTEKTGFDFLKKNRLLFVELDDLKSVNEQLARKIEREKLGALYIDFGEPKEKSNMSIEDIAASYQKQLGGFAENKYFKSSDGTTYSFVVSSTSKERSLKYSRNFVKHVKDSVAAWEKTVQKNQSFQIYFSGKAINQVSEYENLLHDLTLAGIVSWVGIIILLFAYFRSFVAPIIAFIPVLIGLVLSFSVAKFWISELNIVTSFLYSVLSGLGIENGIHFMARYRLEKQHGSSLSEALFAVMNKTGRSIGFSVASVSLIFFSLVFNDFKGFSQFGLIAGLGLLCVYISYILFFSPLVVLAEKLGGIRVPATQTHPHHIHAQKKRRWPTKPVMYFSVIATVFSLWILFTQNLFNYDLLHLRAKLPELALAKQKQLTTTSGGTGPVRVVLQNEEEANAFKAAVRNIMLEQGEPKRVDSVFTYYDLFAKNQPEKIALLRNIKKQLDDPALKLTSQEHQQDIANIREELKQVQPFTQKDIPSDIIERFKGEVGTGVYGLIQPNKNIVLDEGKNGLRLLDLIGEIKTPRKTFYPVSDPIIYASVLKTMLKDAPGAIAIAVLIVLVLIWFDVRTWKSMLLVTLPIFLGELWLVGCMWLLNMQLDFYNMVIVPVVIGMSIDNCIHIYHRFKELGRANLRKVLRTAGLASAVASSTNALGFLGLAFTNHGGLASLGKMAILGLGTTLFSTVIFFPALLALKKHQQSL